MKRIQGVTASPGIAVGLSYIQKKQDYQVMQKDIKIAEVELEVKRFHKVLADAQEEIENIRRKIKKEAGVQEAEIFTAHLQILNDVDFLELVEKFITEEKHTAEVAVQKVIRNFAAKFSGKNDGYIETREADIKDVGNRLMRLLQGLKLDRSIIQQEVILVANDLSPSEVARLDKDRILGLVLAEGSRNSHTSILARSLEIPAVVGVGAEGINSIYQGEKLILDGDNGVIYPSPDEELLAKYSSRLEDIEEREKELSYLKKHKLYREDGTRIYVNANIGGLDDLAPMLERGADGIGLFRTEFIFLDRKELPGEEEQYQVYREIVEKIGDRSVVIRTADIGADKKMDYLDFEEELNPSLGYRGIRICLRNKDIFKNQLKAIFRASAHGDVKILLPMISSLGEIRAANKILRQARLELVEAGVAIGYPQVGIMIEIPSAVTLAREFAEEVDFFSIGTNDLIQYTLAVDRTNDKVEDIFTPYDPAVLRMITRVVTACREVGIPVTLCGEAANRLLLPFWLGIGINKFSMSSVSILRARETIKFWLDKDTSVIAQEVLQRSTAAEIQYYLSRLPDKIENRMHL
ncbi:MAG: phosphoenolpyruvate--protein phosphotransferase [Bacillota bacterium]